MKRKKTKYKVGDQVRIKNIFFRGYNKTFSTQVFEIVDVPLLTFEGSHREVYQEFQPS